MTRDEVRQRAKARDEKRKALLEGFPDAKLSELPLGILHALIPLQDGDRADRLAAERAERQTRDHHPAAA